MRRFVLFIILFLVVASVPSKRADAHPHVFIDCTVAIVLDENGLAAVRHHWLFDEMFTSALLADIVLKPENLATPEGQMHIKKGAFDYLGESHWFTTVDIAGKKVPVTKAADFKASLRNGKRLTYEFTLPLNIPVSKKDVRIAIFDKEYYSDMLLVKDAISVETSGPIQSSYTIAPAEDLAYWGGYNIPLAINLTMAASGSTMPPVTKKGDAKAVSAPAKKRSPWFRLIKQTQVWQKAIKQRLTLIAGDIRDNPFGASFWMFVLLSGLYGVVHAIGPGHGKTVVCSYFLARPGSFWLGAVMGNVLTFVHVASAVAAVTVAWFFLGSKMGGFHKAVGYIQPASYGLLIIVGLVLAFGVLRDLKKGGLLRGAACPIDPDDTAKAGNLRSILTVSFVTGLVPCPGAAVILAFAIGLQILGAGIAAMIAMAIGMGVTTTLFAWAAVSARGVALRLTSRNKAILNWTYAILSVCGALAIVVFGAALLMGSL